jgi:hypothetical protein
MLVDLHKREQGRILISYLQIKKNEKAIKPVNMYFALLGGCAGAGKNKPGH